MVRRVRFLCTIILLIASTTAIAETRPGRAALKRSSRLFVVDAKSGWATKQPENAWRLTLRKPYNVLWFADRPVRNSGYMKASALDADWAKLFAGAPPNGAVTAPDGPAGRSPSAVAITEPHYDARTDELSFLVKALPGQTAKDVEWLDRLTRATAGKNGRVVLFIDDSGTVTFTVVAPQGTVFTILTSPASNCASPSAITDSGLFMGQTGEIYNGSMYINDFGSCDLEVSTAFWSMSGGLGTLELDTEGGSTLPNCATCSVDAVGNIIVSQ